MKNIREKWEIYYQNPLNFSLISLSTLHDFSCESPGILLKIRHCFISYESAKNPYEFCRESPENPWRINAEISLQFPRGFSFHSQPKFFRGFPSTKDAPSPGIPCRIRVILPAGLLLLSLLLLLKSLNMSQISM